jgi:hypothetical protein
MAFEPIPTHNSPGFVQLPIDDPEYEGGPLPIMTFDGLLHFPAHNFLIGGLRRPDGSTCVLVSVTAKTMGLNIAMSPAAAREMAAGFIRIAEQQEAAAEAEAKALMDRIRGEKRDD